MGRCPACGAGRRSGPRAGVDPGQPPRARNRL